MFQGRARIPEQHVEVEWIGGRAVESEGAVERGGPIMQSMGEQHSHTDPICRAQRRDDSIPHEQSAEPRALRPSVDCEPSQQHGWDRVRGVPACPARDVCVSDGDGGECVVAKDLLRLVLNRDIATGFDRAWPFRCRSVLVPGRGLVEEGGKLGAPARRPIQERGELGPSDIAEVEDPAVGKSVFGTLDGCCSDELGQRLAGHPSSVPNHGVLRRGQAHGQASTLALRRVR